MAAQHTPGPWVAKWERYDKHIEIQPFHLSGVPIAWVDYDDVDREEAEATARLIAAAPELLEHLEFAVKLLAVISCETAQLEAMRAAIAKARGLVRNSDGNPEGEDAAAASGEA